MPTTYLSRTSSSPFSIIIKNKKLKMESKPKNRPDSPETKAAAIAQIDSSSRPQAQTQKERLEELEQLQQENTHLLELQAEKKALQAKEEEAYEAIGCRLEADQKVLRALKQKALERGFIPYEKRRQ
jgi:hypothetical protein